MDNFRLYQIQVEDEAYQINKIKLVNSEYDKLTNHFTLILGNNGTGKSKILGDIVRVLKGHTRSKNLYYKKSSNPKKVISISNSLSDKFPIGTPRHYSEARYKDEFYTYLGTRGWMGASPKFLMKRAIDILLENYSNKNISRYYRHIFEYLEYKPVINLTYNIIAQRTLLEQSNELITPNTLENYVLGKKEGSFFNQSIYNKILEKYKHRFKDVCDFLNNLNHQKEKTYELKIDFSSLNIKHLEQDNSQYESTAQNYEILSILGKLNMIRSSDVTLFKKYNKPFSFSDASSGEANILSTLIALIPLIENNSCVLIDEPELSLHPDWQYRYIELLNKIFKDFKGCHIIIASHSPFLASDLPIGGASIVVLKKEKGAIKSELLDESTFGWSVEDILLNVFNMPTTRNHYTYKIVSEALELIAKKQKRTNRFKQIKEELKSVESNLKEDDSLKLVINSIFKV